jgi:hypothetical protein
MLRRCVELAIGSVASLLPHRLWEKLPPQVAVESGAFVSGVLTWMAGVAIGIPGFIAHAHGATSLGIDAMLHNIFTNPNAGYSQGMVQGFSALSIFTFLLLTPLGWLTVYLVGTGAVRGVAAWLDDPFGEPLLTGVDYLISRGWTRRTSRRAIETREALEGPEVADRVVSPGAAGLTDCDFAIVASRRKPGWERGVAVFTQDGCYRLGEPVERTINGRLRTLYPLKEHRDFEAIRKSVRYDLPKGQVPNSTGAPC